MSEIKTTDSINIIEVIQQGPKGSKGDSLIVSSSNATIKISGSQYSGSMLTALEITGSILPEGNGTWDLGAPNHPFRELFVASESINFVDTNTGIATKLTKTDVDNLKAGIPISADPLIDIGGVERSDYIRPSALIHPTQDTPTVDLTTAGRFKYTSMGGVMLDIYNDSGSNNYINLGIPELSMKSSPPSTKTTINGHLVVNSLIVTGSNTLTNWGNFKNRFQTNDKYFTVTTDPTFDGGWRDDNPVPSDTIGSAPHLHFQLSGSGQAGIGLLNPSHTLHVSESSADFNALQVEGQSQFNGVVAGMTLGNATTISTHVNVPSGYNAVLYTSNANPSITVNAGVNYNINAGADVLITNMNNI